MGRSAAKGRNERHYEPAQCQRPKNDEWRHQVSPCRIVHLKRVQPIYEPSKPEAAEYEPVYPPFVHDQKQSLPVWPAGRQPRHA